MTLALRSGLGYRNADGRIGSDDDPSASGRNFISFRRVTRRSVLHLVSLRSLGGSTAWPGGLHADARLFHALLVIPPPTVVAGGIIFYC